VVGEVDGGGVRVGDVVGEDVTGVVRVAVVVVGDVGGGVRVSEMVGGNVSGGSRVACVAALESLVWLEETSVVLMSRWGSWRRRRSCFRSWWWLRESVVRFKKASLVNWELLVWWFEETSVVA